MSGRSAGLRVHAGQALLVLAVALLCHEAYRESYWRVRPADRPLLIGTTLLRLAKREEAKWQERADSFARD